MRARIAMALAGLLLGGCTSLLPRGEEQMVSQWKDYADVKSAFDRIEVGGSDSGAVHALGFDPTATPNVRILNYSQIAQAVLPVNGKIPEVEPPAGIRSCLVAQDRCLGYLLEESRVKRRRVGGFWADFLNFRRETLTTGWRFNAMVVMVDDRVVFKQWSGQPDVRQIGVSRNPLGPLQGAGERMSSVFR